AAFAFLLARKKTTIAQTWPVVFFAAASVASFSAAIFHGYFERPEVPQDAIFWPATMIAIGVTSLAAFRIAAVLSLAPTVHVIAARLAWVLFALYCVVALFVSSDFRVAIAGYAPSILFLGAAFVHKYKSHNSRVYLCGVVGILIIAVASITQQAKVGIDPRYFNHNALYHLLQGAGLFAIFLALWKPR